jgi:hypothetical protein
MKQTSIPLHNKPTTCHEPDLSVDEDDLQGVIEPAFCENSYGADSLARVLFCLHKAIEGGPEQMASAFYIPGHQAGFRLYKLHLAGDLSPDNELLSLINTAVERGEAERIKHTYEKYRHQEKEGS